MDGECHILSRVVRPGPERVPQGLLLGVLLALLLLVAVLAAALIFNYRRRKQLGELSAPLPTQSVPPNRGISKALYPLSAQALEVCPHPLGTRQPLGVWRGWPPRAVFPRSCL